MTTFRLPTAVLGAFALGLLLAHAACSSEPIRVPQDAGADVAAETGGMDGSAALKVVRVAAGGEHACALLETGAVWCWGRNDHGQLGNGSTTDSPAPVAVKIDGVVFEDLAAGDRHTCAISSAGKVYCWGTGADGRLGNGAMADAPAPVQVQMLQSARIVVAGFDFTCALGKTTGDEGTYCWGANGEGQLGDGTNDAQSAPVLASALADSLPASQASAKHACLRTANGGAQCWGNNSNGQLNDGSTSASNVPVGPTAGSFGPVAVGGRHSCFVPPDDDPGILCRGANESGQLGDGTMTENNIQRFVALGGAVLGVVLAEAASCAVVKGGVAQCWGDNAKGQLGIGSTTNSPSPVAVPGLSAITAISGGRAFFCAVAAGKAKCWGDNAKGQLGDGTSTNRTAPVDVIGLP